MEGHRNKSTAMCISISSLRINVSDQTYSDTLLIAMFKVKSVENATRVKFSRSVSFESFICPVTRSNEQPMLVLKA